jgi:hypothetical protein
MRVYVAGPISKGPLERNIRRALDAANLLMHNGFHPYVPHLCCFFDITHPHPYERWMELGFAYISACEAVFRLEGESTGADRECEFAEAFGIPVFYNIHDLIGYRDQKSQVRELAPNLQGMEPPKVRSPGELPSLGRTVHNGERSEEAGEDSEEDTRGMGS